MADHSTKYRRSLGVICLITAIVMLLAGETILRERLTGVGLLVYWLTCLALTCLAAVVAIKDMARVRRESRAEQRKLLEQTLREVEREPARREPSRE
jgi:hypothetical protein